MGTLLEEYGGSHRIDSLGAAGAQLYAPGGRVVRVADIDADGRDLFLPDATLLHPGGPYFYVVNADDAFDLDLEYRDDNLLSVPEDFTSATWVKSGTSILSSSETDPIGGSTAERVQFGGGVTTLTQTATITNDVPHIMAIFARVFDGTAPYELRLGIGSDQNFFIPKDDEWHVLDVRVVSGSSNDFVVTGTGSRQVVLWGASLLEASKARDYVPQSYGTVKTVGEGQASQVWLSGRPFTGVAQRWEASDPVTFSEGGTITSS